MLRERRKSPTISSEDNKQLVRRFYEEVWSKGNLDVADEVFASDYVRHDLRPSNPAPGPEGQKQIASAFRAAFPDLRFDVEFVFAEGDYVAGRWTATGTHTGVWGDVEPTGRLVTFSAVNVFRFDEGRVAEIWNHRDDLGLQEQLGVSVHAGAPPRA
ncbi:MAG TPA: ester cyclase [Gaiella sp.]|nr:ester cyclase [Gaiella sp.]